MSTVSYVLRDAYATNYSGGVLSVGSGRTFNVAQELANGAGTVVIDGDDVALVQALDGYPALRRSGSSDTSTPPQRLRTGSLLVSQLSPVGSSAGSVPVLQTDGTWLAQALSSLVVSSSQPGRVWTPLGYRARTPYNSTGNYPASPQSNGTNLGATFRIKDTAQISGQGIRVGFAFFINNAGETDNGYDVTISRVTLETVTNQNLPLTINGQASVTFKGTTPKIHKVMFDPLGMAIVKGTDYWIRCDVTVAAGSKYPIHLTSRGRATFGEGVNADPTLAGPGADVTGYGAGWAAVGLDAVRLFGPAIILTRPKKAVSTLLALTDSIGVGTGETSAPVQDHWDEGWITRAVRDRWPHYIAGLSGENLDRWTSNGLGKSVGRRGFMAEVDATHLLCQLGINNVLAGEDLAMIKGKLLVVWNDLLNYGKPVYQSTLTPATVTTTDTYTTVAGQTANAFASVVATVNDWLRDGAPIDTSNGTAAATGTSGATIARAGQYLSTSAGIAVVNALGGAAGHPLAGVLEVADAVETARGSGLWKALPGSRKVTDAAMPSASNILTSATAAFTANDVGRLVIISGAGASGALLSTYITGYTDATHVTTNANASTSVSAATLSVGAMGTTADGIHPSGTAGPDPGGHELIANYVRPQLAAILGSQST